MTHRKYRLSLIEDLVRRLLKSNFRLERRRPGQPRDQSVSEVGWMSSSNGKTKEGLSQDLLLQNMC